MLFHIIGMHTDVYLYMHLSVSLSLYVHESVTHMFIHVNTYTYTKLLLLVPSAHFGYCPLVACCLLPISRPPIHSNSVKSQEVLAQSAMARTVSDATSKIASLERDLLVFLAEFSKREQKCSKHIANT